MQLRATQEINRLQDAYPAPKEKVEDSQPITIVFGKVGSMMPLAEEKKPKTDEK